MSPQEQQARLDGQCAALGEKPFSANPHPLSTTCSRAWSRGWREVSEQMKKQVAA